MKKAQQEPFEIETPEQALLLWCGYVITFANRLYVTPAASGEPIEPVSKKDLLQSLQSIAERMRFVSDQGRIVLKMRLYKDNVLEILSCLGGLAAALSGAMSDIKELSEPAEINKVYDRAVMQGQDVREKLTAVSSEFYEQLLAHLHTRLPIGPTARKILNMLLALDETQGMTSETMSEKLANLPYDRENLDASTIRKNHLPQLVPYGLVKTQHGYCIR